ncbi:MAG: protein kinase [Thermoleophilaceae bacterium]
MKGHLGSGGMASVLLCEDEHLGRKVAVKRLHSDSPSESVRRFVREAKLGASLNHPNIVSVFDTLSDDEGVLIVMEYVEGEALSSALKRGPLDERRVAAIARDLGSALDHAHDSGVVHRDVKPGNVLLGAGGTTKLVDLGIATAVDQTRITHGGTVLGTAAYMAPEQLGGGEIGPYTDIYGLAAVLYEALAGRRPRPGRTPLEIAHRIATEEPPDIRDVLPRAPGEAAEALKRGMSREPAGRPGSAGELAREVAHALDARSAAADGPPTAATRFVQEERAAPPPAKPPPAKPPPATPPPALPGRPASGPRRPARGSRRPAAAVVLALVLVAVAAAAVIGAALSSDDGGDEGRQAAGEQAQESGGAKAKKKTNKKNSDTGQSGAQAPAAEPEATPEEPAEEPADEPSEEPAEEPTTVGPARGAELNDQGFALIQQGDFAGAVPVLQEAVASWPEDSRELTYAYALFNLGQALNRSGRAAEAIPYLEKRLTWDNQTDKVQAELDDARRNAG